VTPPDFKLGRPHVRFVRQYGRAYVM